MRLRFVCTPAAMQLTLCALFLFAYPPATLAASTEDILKAIVKVEATVPPDARSARTLGTARSGHDG